MIVEEHLPSDPNFCIAALCDVLDLKSDPICLEHKILIKVRHGKLPLLVRIVREVGMSDVIGQEV